MKKVLTIAPHPDDETLGTGGAMLKHKDLGDEIYWALITNRIRDFDYKSKKNNTSDINDNNRQQEIDKVSELFGFDGIFQLDFPDMFLDNIELSKIIYKLQEIVQSIKPEIVYVPFYNDIHTDHQVVFKAAIASTKNFRAPFIERVLMYEIPSSTDFAIGRQFNPNTFIDIGNYFEKKLEIYSVYKSEILKSPFPRAFDSLRAYSRTRGARCGCRYAEAFELIFEKA